MKTLAHAEELTEVLQRVRAVRPDSKARWGRMSAHQMICHLSDAFRTASGEKSVAPVGGLVHRTLIKWIAVWAPLRWPEGIQTPPEVDQEIGGTRPQEFARDVERLESLLLAFVQSANTIRAEHPIFGRMSPRAWLRWGYLHADHHLRQFGL